MGRKLGNALIIYGVLNFFACFLFGPYAVIAGFVWMIIMIVVGNWQRGKARAEETMDEQTELLESINRKSSYNKNKMIDNDALANAINKILDEREGQRVKKP